MNKSNQFSLFDLPSVDLAAKRKQYEDRIFGAVRPNPQVKDKCWYYDGSQYVLMVVTGVSRSGKTFRCVEFTDKPTDKNLLIAWDIPANSFKPYSHCQFKPIF